MPPDLVPVGASAIQQPSGVRCITSRHGRLGPPMCGSGPRRPIRAATERPGPRVPRWVTRLDTRSRQRTVESDRSTKTCTGTTPERVGWLVGRAAALSKR